MPAFLLYKRVPRRSQASSTLLTHHDTGHGTYKGIYLRTGVTKYKFDGGDSTQSYISKGESLTIGLGINQKLDSNTSFLVGADVELRKQNASGEQLTLRLGSTLYHQWATNDKLSVTLSYAPRFDSYWASVMNAHSITGDGWYVGPQFSATGEQKYSSKSIAAVVGKSSIRKGDLGFDGFYWCF